MSTTLIRAYESFFTLIDVEGTTEGRSLAVSANKSYAQVFYAKENSSQPRFFFMADIPDTNNLIVKIYTVNVTGSGSSSSYTPDTELVSLSGEFSYLNTPDNEDQPFNDALWYYIDTEVNLVQGQYYAIVFSSSETVESNSPKIYFSKKYRSEIFPIFLGKTFTESWSNELVPTSSSGSVRSGSFVVGFTGHEVDSVTNFDSGTVSIGGTGASARRGYATYLYVEKESNISNDVAIQFFQEPPDDTAADGTSEETDQSMMRFYYFKKGTLPLSGKAFYNKTTNSNPTLDENANFIVYTQPDRLPPIPKPYLPDGYMDTDYRQVGMVSIYESFENSNHEIEASRGIIEDTSDRSSLEYWAHFAEMRSAYTKTQADVTAGDWTDYEVGDRIPQKSSNPAYLDFSLEKKGNEVESLGSVSLAEQNNPVDNLSESENIRGYTNIVRVGNFFLGFPKYKTYGYDWYADSGGLTGGAPLYEWDGSESRIEFRGIIAHVDSPDFWDFVTIKIKSDFDPYDLGSGASIDARGHYPYESLLGNPNSSSAFYSQRYIGMHDTYVSKSSGGSTRLFALAQMFPGHKDAPSGETDVLKPIRPFYNLIVSFTDFDVDTAPSAITFKAIPVENSDPYDGRFEARQLEVGYMGGTGGDYGIITDWVTATGYVYGNKVYSAGRIYICSENHTSGTFQTDLDDGKWTLWKEDRTYPNIDSDYKAAKFIETSIGNNSYLYFTVFNNRHDSRTYAPHEDRRYGPIDAISKFGIWKISKSINNVDFRTNSIEATQVQTSSFQRDLYVRASAAKTNEYKGNWVTGTTYVINDLVIYEGDLYKCSSGHTAAASFETDYPGNWVWFGLAGNLDGRGFDPYLEHEYEISYTLNFGGRFYLGTCTALTQTSPSNAIETFFDWTASTQYQLGDYVSDGGSPETIYFCVQDHTSGTFVTDVENDIWISSSEFKTNMGEVYQTDDFVNFEEVIDGKIDQDWLDGYTDRSINLTTESLIDYPFSNNDRVVFMDLIDNILHVWTSASAKYQSSYDLRTPFHIAHDINFGKTKVLRKFPIWYDFEENIFFDMSANTSAVAWTNQSYSKGDIIIESGTYYVAARNIVNPGGAGPDTNSFEEQLGNKLWRSQWLPDFIKNDEFRYGYYVTRFINGIKSGNNIYLCGIHGEDIDAYKTSYPQYKGSIKWIQYDRRTINDAFYYYDDINYKIDSNQTDFDDVTATDPIYQWSDGDNSLAVAPYRLMEFFGSKWGVYHHKTIAKYNYFKSSNLLRQYPALNIGENNPRTGKYCAMVSGSTTYNPTDGPAPVPAGNLEGDMYSFNPTLIEQAGICYLIADNYNRGGQVYKTYGIKQKPSDWGLTRVNTGSFSDSTYTNLEDEGNIYGINTYNFDFENPSFERSLPGYSTLNEFNSFKIEVSKTGNVTFFTELKDDIDESGALENKNIIDFDINKRNIFRLTTATNLPQNVSFLYNLKEISFDPWDIISDDDLTAGQKNPTDYLVDPTATNFTLKYAETLEQLFDEPTSIEIPLAQERIVDVGLFDKVMLYNKSFPTDIQPNFFRLESSKLIKDTDEPATYTADDYVAYDESTGTKTIADPFAEVIVKGLRFSDINFSGAIESLPLADKKIVVSGITHSNVYSGSSISNPEEIISENTNAGALFITNNFAVILFPKPIYVSSISFKAFYDGFDAGSGDLSVFNISAIPILEKEVYNRNLYSDEDWISLGDINFDISRDQDLTLSGVGIYTKGIRIKLSSGVTLRVNNLKFKTFIQDKNNTFTTSGNVFNPELILVDDLRGIISGTTNTTTDTAYASFRNHNSSLTINLGEEIPINRITANIVNAESTRTIRVEVADSSDIFETVYTGTIQNYEYSLVQWIPRGKNESRTVDIRVLDTETQEELSTTYSNDLIDFILNNHSSNFSTNFDENILARYSFRPNIFGGKTLTIFGSSNETSQNNFDGSIILNTQMDEDGYFSDDILMGLGMIERPLNVDFPLKNIKKVRITVLNTGSNLIRMNGFKVYTPLVDNNGDYVTPLSQVNWNIRLSSVVV